jgi:hypothetical protein
LRCTSATPSKNVAYFAVGIRCPGSVLRKDPVRNSLAAQGWIGKRCPSDVCDVVDVSAVIDSMLRMQTIRIRTPDPGRPR